MTDTLKTSPVRMSVDPTPTGHLLLVCISDDLESYVLRLNRGQAERLAHRLYDMAQLLERGQQ